MSDPTRRRLEHPAHLRRRRSAGRAAHVHRGRPDAGVLMLGRLGSAASDEDVGARRRATSGRRPPYGRAGRRGDRPRGRPPTTAGRPGRPHRPAAERAERRPRLLATAGRWRSPAWPAGSPASCAASCCVAALGTGAGRQRVQRRQQPPEHGLRAAARRRAVQRADPAARPRPGARTRTAASAYTQRLLSIATAALGALTLARGGRRAAASPRLFVASRPAARADQHRSRRCCCRRSSSTAWARCSWPC